MNARLGQILASTLGVCAAQGSGRFWVRGTLLHKFSSRAVPAESADMDAEDEAQRDHEVRLLCSVESSAVSLEGAEARHWPYGGNAQRRHMHTTGLVSIELSRMRIGERKGHVCGTRSTISGCSRCSCVITQSCIDTEKKARLKATPTLLPQPKPAIERSAARRLLTVNPLLVVSLILALAAVLFQVPHRHGLANPL